ncbi:MAG: hypothetical protein A3E78_11695 [Alphaproteobacteria bacterium RIFCSPHIGHO2_12_FULL_63_12]|nr:MAG: hypothetical protein A3E78_11695 [Alphaproteobacteria bacterium RIFCSPHIGHO2_12_FULL_63_12]
MPRSISTAFRTAIERQHSDDAALELVWIQHPDLIEAMGFANNTEDVVSNGRTYLGFPFELTRPDESDGQALGSISIQNVDREIGDEVLALDGPLTISLYVVLADDPNEIEIAIEDLVLRGVEGDAMTISGDIGLRYDLATIAYPGLRATQVRCPGLWR